MLAIRTGLCLRLARSFPEGSRLSPAARKDLHLSLMLLAILLLGAGIPLAVGYGQSRRISGDPERLRGILQDRIGEEKGSFQTAVWTMGTVKLFPDEKSRDMVLARANDERVFVRGSMIRILMDHYADQPEARSEIERFVLDPRENANLRSVILLDYPDLLASEAGQAGMELLRRQRGLFPEKGYFVKDF